MAGQMPMPAPQAPQSQMPPQHSNMPPQGAPSGGQPPQKGGGVGELLITINSGLNKLGQLIGRSQLPPEDKKQFEGIMSGFQQFAENLTAPQGQQQPQAPQSPGMVPEQTMGRPSKPMM